MYDSMQSGSEALLALLLAHLLADFPLQTSWMVEGKARRRLSAFTAHLVTHLGVTLAALLFFTSVPIARPRTWAVLGLLLSGHALLDLVKTTLIRNRPAWDGAALFLADQVAHVAIILGVALLLPEVSFATWDIGASWHGVRSRMLVEAVVLVAFVFPTGYLIRYLLKPLSRALPSRDDAPENPTGGGLANAGLILGWIERALLIFAFAEASLTAVGLIVGAKSIARFPEFEKRAFAEYFLIGTLLSVGFAGIGGWMLRALRAVLSSTC